MSDRNNLIKFGPEWLRNLSREGSATQSTASGSTPPNTAPGNFAGASANTPLKIHLAKLRYGREEFLALYDRNVLPPAELKQFDALYNPRGKPPVALNTTFEEDMRDSMRSSMGGMASGERMGIGRGGAQQGDGRGRGRSSYSRLSSIGRGYKTGLTGPMGYPERGGDEPFEVPTNSNRAWGTSNGGNATHRNGADPNAEWMQTNKVFRGGQRWQGHTNWRRHVGREEGEEWRSTQDPHKTRPNVQEKWERDWNERGDRGQTSRDNKNQSWNTNRRTWGTSDDNLPEWAVENSEACGGTFDSSGAFHGFSNDDTNLPKPPVPDPVYPLTRSHTQGSFTRAKVDEDGSDEWWASEKAKKLSPKRFDASEIKFKKQISAPEGGQASAPNEETQSKFPENQESEPNDSKSEEKFGRKVQFKRSLLESKTFDGANRSDVNLDEANDERGNFKSVIISPNNALRTRHQNIVSSSNEDTRPNAQSVQSTQSGKSNTTTATSAASAAASAIESGKQKGSQEEKIVNDMLNLNVPQRPQENMGSDMMGYTFNEQDLSNIPLPPATKAAKPGLVQQRPQENMGGDMMGYTFNEQDLTNIPLPPATKAAKAGLANIPFPPAANPAKPGLANMPLPPAPNSAKPGLVPQRPQENMVGDMMGYTLDYSLDVAHIPLPKGPDPARLGLNVAQPKVLPVASSMSAMKTPGLHNIGVSNTGLATGMSAVVTSGLSTASYQSTGKPAGSMASAISSYGNVGLGNPGMGNSVNHTHTLGGSRHGGLGNLAHGGLGNAGLVKLAHSAHNNPVHPGLGNMQHSSLGNSAHSGLGNVGLGNSGHPGLGNAGLGNSHAGLRSSPHSVLGNSQHLANVGLGHSAHGLGTQGLGLQFGSASSSLGLSSSGLSGATAAPGAALFSNTGPNSATKNSLFNSNIGTSDMNSGQSKAVASSMFQLRDLQPPSPQGGYGGSVYGSVQQPPPPQTDMWYYEDPTKNIQGPFSSKEMYHWYRAGFFTSSLMVRRACDTHMQPLGSYGPVAPFAMDLLQSSFSNRLDGRPQSSHDSILNQQSSLGLGNDVMNQMNLNEPALDNMQFGNVGNNFIRNTSFPQQPMETLWSQSASSGSDLWLQPPVAQTRADSRANNNLNMFFWEQQPSVIASNSLLPEEITKEMKTEDQILAQIRSSQNMANNRTVPFVKQETQDVSVESVLCKPEETPAPAHLGATPDLGELEKLIQKETLSAIAPHSDSSLDNLNNFLSTHDKKNLNGESILISNVNLQNKTVVQQQQPKNKSDGDKTVVKKDTTSTKKKKTKDEKRDESTDLKKEDDCYKNEKAQEAAMFNAKKEDKASKKEMEKEKKEWLREGFTLVKGPEKSASKDKKKVDDFKAMEEAEKKRREEEKNSAEKEKKRVEILKRSDAAAPGHGRQALADGGGGGGAIRKAPWSAVSAHSLQAPSKEGLTLAEIQRLEREKKLEMIKEQQQQMMQMLAQQNQAQLAREQEMSQNVIGWAKKKDNASLPTNLSLAEIQAETRKQSAAAAAAAAAEAAELAVNQALEQGFAPPPALPPWKATPNERSKKIKNSAATEKKEESKPVETKAKKKNAQAAAAAAVAAAVAGPSTAPVAGPSTGAIAKTSSKKEANPMLEFEAWCNHSLSAWTSKIDVPTFVGFLKDIESPYEVKDYVKCYLGETKDSNDFARHFLERRSKLLRASTVTPVDDLCSPAAAINPRGGLDFSEGKGKKPKKNKMLKVDARILGFSVTAAEDRINVGDIDTV